MIGLSPLSGYNIDPSGIIKCRPTLVQSENYWGISGEPPVLIFSVFVTSFPGNPRVYPEGPYKIVPVFRARCHFVQMIFWDPSDIPWEPSGLSRVLWVCYRFGPALFLELSGYIPGEIPGIIKCSHCSLVVCRLVGYDKRTSGYNKLSQSIALIPTRKEREREHVQSGGRIRISGHSNDFQYPPPSHVFQFCQRFSNFCCQSAATTLSDQK